MTVKIAQTTPWIQELLRGMKITGFWGGPWRAGEGTGYFGPEMVGEMEGQRRRYLVRKVLYKLASRMLLFLCHSSRLHIMIANLPS